jgi:hypothetical protein
MYMGQKEQEGNWSERSGALPLAAGINEGGHYFTYFFLFSCSSSSSYHHYSKPQKGLS